MGASDPSNKQRQGRPCQGLPKNSQPSRRHNFLDLNSGSPNCGLFVPPFTLNNFRASSLIHFMAGGRRRATGGGATRRCSHGGHAVGHQGCRIARLGGIPEGKVTSLGTRELMLNSCPLQYGDGNIRFIINRSIPLLRWGVVATARGQGNWLGGGMMQLTLTGNPDPNSQLRFLDKRF